MASVKVLLKSQPSLSPEKVRHGFSVTEKRNAGIDIVLNRPFSCTAARRRAGEGRDEPSVVGEPCLLVPAPFSARLSVVASVAPPAHTAAPAGPRGNRGHS